MNTGKFLLTFMLLLAASCRLPDSGFGSVEGRITMAGSGEPVAGSYVVYGDSAVYTDEEGYFLYENAPEGLQGFFFKADGYDSKMLQVNIPRGEKASCEVTLDLITTGWAVGKQDTDYGTILRTTDKGANWLRQGTSAMIPGVTLTGVCAVDASSCWVSGEADTLYGRSVILLTTDGGSTWSNCGRSISAEGPVSFSDIAATDRDTAYAAAADTGLIYKTTNGGSSWQVCYESASCSGYSAISTYDGLHIWCCGESPEGGWTAEFSPDGGRTWHTVRTQGDGTANGIYALDDAVFIAGTGGIFHSADNGSTWRFIELDGGGAINSIYAFDSDLIWAAAGNGRILYTEDTFASFDNTAGSGYSDRNFYSVSMLRDGLNGAAAALSATGETGVIIHTADGGRTWTESGIPTQFAITEIDFAGGS